MTTPSTPDPPDRIAYRIDFVPPAAPTGPSSPANYLRAAEIRYHRDPEFHHRCVLTERLAVQTRPRDVLPGRERAALRAGIVLALWLADRATAGDPATGWTWGAGPGEAS